MAVGGLCDISECKNTVMRDSDFCISHRNHGKCPKCSQVLRFPLSFTGVLECPKCHHQSPTPNFKENELGSVWLPDLPSPPPVKKEGGPSKKVRPPKKTNNKSRTNLAPKMSYNVMLNYGVENFKFYILIGLCSFPFFLVGFVEEDDFLTSVFFLLGIIVSSVGFLGLSTKLVADAVSYAIHINSDK